MKKMLYFVPAVLAFAFYIVLATVSGFGAINPLVWVFVALLFVSAIVMACGKWFGCVGGMIVAVVLIYMSTQCTGQAINIEMPLGIVLCIYYAVCGFFVWKKNK